MKIKKIHIENFGKLSNMTMDFSDDLNIIAKKNGYGKSTLAAFIRIMFYGFAGEGKKSITDNERRRYKSWQGGVYGGSLDFEAEGKTYRITRIFGTKQKDDTFSLYDLALNMESEDFSSNIGEELFKIDAEAFERTVFIGQQDCMTNISDSISAKIGNLSENTDDINNYENVMKRLKDMLNAMSPTRATGSIKNLDNKIGDIRVSILKGDEIDNSIKMLNEKLEKEKQEKAALKERLKSVREDIKRAGAMGELAAKKKLYEKLCAGYEEAKRNKEGFKELKPVGDDLSTPQGVKSLPILLVGIILIAAGIFLFAANKSAGIFIGIVGVISLFFSLYLKNKQKKKEQINERIREQINKQKKEQQELYMRITDEMIRARREKEEFERENDMEKLKAFVPNKEALSIDSLNGELSHITEELESVQDNMLSYMRQRDKLKEERDEVSEEERTLVRLEEERALQKKKYEALTLTKKLLEKAKDGFTSKYTTPVKDSFDKYHKIFMGTEGSEYEIDAAINLSVTEMGDKRDIRLLSSGLRDISGICMRMALIEAMYKNEKPFIVLDDSFASLDDEKLKGAKELLAQISREYQIIYFTCRKQFLT